MHKRKKVKLAVLKYYEVEENGKIVCLHWEHPSDECGAGGVMAGHLTDVIVVKVRQTCQGGRLHREAIFDENLAWDLKPCVNFMPIMNNKRNIEIYRQIKYGSLFSIKVLLS